MTEDSDSDNIAPAGEADIAPAEGAAAGAEIDIAPAEGAAAGAEMDIAPAEGAQPPEPLREPSRPKEPALQPVPICRYSIATATAHSATAHSATAHSTEDRQQKTHEAKQT